MRLAGLDSATVGSRRLECCHVCSWVRDCLRPRTPAGLAELARAQTADRMRLLRSPAGPQAAKRRGPRYGSQCDRTAHYPYGPRSPGGDRVAERGPCTPAELPERMTAARGCCDSGLRPIRYSEGEQPAYAVNLNLLTAFAGGSARRRRDEERRRRGPGRSGVHARRAARRVAGAGRAPPADHRRRRLPGATTSPTPRCISTARHPRASASRSPSTTISPAARRPGSRSCGQRASSSCQTHDMSQPLPSGFGPFDYIIHGASIASPTYYRAHPVETMDVNINGLRNLLDYARQQQGSATPVRGLLFLSSSEIYGDPDPASIPTPETYRGIVSCTGPRACYDEAKRYGETLCTSLPGSTAAGTDCASVQQLWSGAEDQRWPGAAGFCPGRAERPRHRDAVRRVGRRGPSATRRFGHGLLQGARPRA